MTSVKNRAFHPLLGIHYVLVVCLGCSYSEREVSLLSAKPSGESELCSLGVTLFRPPYYEHSPPLLTFLNGRGQNGQDGLSLRGNLGAQFWEMRREFPLGIIAPQCSKEGQWSKSSKDIIEAMRAVERVVTSLDMDADRVILTGVSSGGSGVWISGAERYERFAAVVPLCGNGGGDLTSLLRSALPVWHVCNDGDAEELVHANRTVHHDLIMAGSSPIYIEYHRSGHDCWNQAYRNKAMFEWILQQSRSKNKRESEKFRLIDGDVDQQNEGLSREGNELLGTERGGFKTITCGEFPGLIDLHLHAKYTSDQTLAVRLESADSSKLFVLHLPYSSAGPATLTEKSQNVLAFISPRAQNQLDPLGWNDIRLRVEKDRVSVMINGFSAVDQTLDLSGTKGWKVSLVPSGPESSDMRFRYIRWRPLTWLMTSNP